MAHHYVMAFGAKGEKRAFAQFLRDFPDRRVLLIDNLRFAPRHRAGHRCEPGDGDLPARGSA
jgi:hypothetical protein